MARPNAKKLLAEARKALAQGNLPYTIALLREAHAASPGDAAAARLLGEALVAMDQPMDAIEVLAGHLAENSRSADAARMLSNLLAAVTPVSWATVDPRGLTSALSQDQVTPDPIARAAGLLLAERGGVTAAREAADLRALLIAMLWAAPVTEPSLECAFVAIRRDWLLGEQPATDDALVAALSCQAWLNEYVWPVSAEEAAVLDQNQQAMPNHVKALYQPPNVDDEADTDGALATLFSTICREQREMDKSDQSLGDRIVPAGAAGAAVAAQYEDNPYPRWRWTQAPPAGAARGVLADIAPDHPEDLKGGWEKGQLRLLIAGCGTGQQAVQAAQAYAPRADVLAFDFSRASLRYAAMKARQHRVTNIRFRQADILDLPVFDRPFDGPVDLIECVGVLHHLADPFAGWRALLGHLKPGAVMYVGLYSAQARQALTRLRAHLSEQQIDPSDHDAIRNIRARMLSEPADDFERSLADSADFHTLSNVRDLLFHAHETPLSLDEIGTFLDTEDLDFLGMDVRPHILQAFQDSEGLTATENLDAWKRFEEAHPDSFDGMYLFWIQKPL